MCSHTSRLVHFCSWLRCLIYKVHAAALADSFNRLPHLSAFVKYFFYFLSAFFDRVLCFLSSATHNCITFAQANDESVAIIPNQSDLVNTFFEFFYFFYGQYAHFPRSYTASFPEYKRKCAARPSPIASTFPLATAAAEGSQPLLYVLCGIFRSVHIFILIFRQSPLPSAEKRLKAA